MALTRFSLLGTRRKSSISARLVQGKPKMSPGVIRVSNSGLVGTALTGCSLQDTLVGIERNITARQKAKLILQKQNYLCLLKLRSKGKFLALS